MCLSAGDDRALQTTYGESCSKVKEAIYEPRKKVNKNASDEVFDGGYRYEFCRNLCNVEELLESA